MNKLEEALSHIDLASAMIVLDDKPANIFDQLHKAVAIIEGLLDDEKTKVSKV